MVLLEYGAFSKAFIFILWKVHKSCEPEVEDWKQSLSHLALDRFWGVSSLKPQPVSSPQMWCGAGAAVALSCQGRLPGDVSVGTLQCALEGQPPPALSGLTWIPAKPLVCGVICNNNQAVRTHRGAGRASYCHKLRPHWSLMGTCLWARWSGTLSWCLYCTYKAVFPSCLCWFYFVGVYFHCKSWKSKSPITREFKIGYVVLYDPYSNSKLVLRPCSVCVYK